MFSIDWPSSQLFCLCRACCSSATSCHAFSSSFLERADRKFGLRAAQGELKVSGRDSSHVVIAPI